LSVAEQILNALYRRLASVAPVLRNAALPERIPPQGLLILRDGTPALEEASLGGLGGYYYRHEIEVEVYVQHKDTESRDQQFDALLQTIGQVLANDPTLEGLACGLDYARPAMEVEGREGIEAIKQATLIVTAEYGTQRALS